MLHDVRELPETSVANEIDVVVFFDEQHVFGCYRPREPLLQISPRIFSQSLCVMQVAQLALRKTNYAYVSNLLNYTVQKVALTLIHILNSIIICVYNNNSNTKIEACQGGLYARSY
jgi:hypothetical protein